MQDPLKPVNLPFNAPDLVGNYNTSYQPDNITVNPQDYHNDISNFLQQHSKGAGQDFTATPSKDIDFSGRYPLFFPGQDNESMYANAQTGFDKAYNGVAKMVGTASSTFLEGTAGLVYGIYKGIDDGKFSSFYDNKLTNSLNEWTQGLENTYAHYKSERERNANWWEPTNLFSGNFLWDGIVKNLGFSLGAAISGFAWGGALEAIGLTGKLVSTGTEMAAAADKVISKATILPEVERLSTINTKLNSLWSQTKGAIGSGLMKADQGIVATFGTVGESGMEALNNSQEFRKNMIDEFTKTHGYAPSGKDLETINSNAESVGNWSFGLNTALLTATNYIQLPKIYSSSFKAEKNILNGVAYEAEKYVESLPKEGFGKLLYKSKNLASLFFNESEAFEEGAQYAIQTGTQNYYNKKYHNQERSALDDGLLYGIKEALTTGEGTLNIFTGGFSGALQSSGVVGIKRNEQDKYRPVIGQTGKIGERGVFGYGGEEGKLREEAISALNNSTIKDKLKEAYSNIKASEIIQKEREAAIRQGDILESKDLEFDYAHNFITTRLKYNAKTAIDNEIKELKQNALTNFDVLKQQGVAADTDTKESFISRLDNLQQHADSTSKMYDSVSTKYKGLVNKETGKRIYSDDVLDKLVYAGSKILDYDKRIPQLNSSLSQNGINTIDILNSILTEGVPKEESVKNAINEIKKLNSINEEDLITDLKDIIELSLRRKSFINEYNDIKAKPENYKEQEPVIKDKEGNVIDENGKIVPKETITIKTKKGDKNIEIGTEYLIGKVIKYDKEGNEVIQDPVLTIIGDNGDGTYKIKDSKNNVRDIDAKTLEDYQLSKLSDITSDKKKNYVYVNRNNLFSNKLIKDSEGKPVIGRLEYSQKEDRLIFAYKDEKGKVIRSEVWNNMFKAKEGFKDAIITKVGELTAEENKATKEFTEAKTTISKRLETRNNIILDLYEKSTKRVEEVSKQLENNKEKLNKITSSLEEQLAKESLTKKGTPRKNQTPAMKKIINELSSLQNNIDKENEQLKLEKEELESNIPFFKDFLDNLESFPESGREMINLLKSDINTLEDLIDITNQAIKDNTSLLKQIEDSFLKAVSIFNDFIKRLQQENKGVPLFIDDLQSNLEKVLGEKGAQYYIDNKQGITSQVLELESDINDFSEELKIPSLNNKAEELVNDIKELKEGLDKLINEQIAKKEILNAFEQFAEDVKKQEAEEKQMQRNVVLQKELLGTLSESVQNFFGTTPYEPEAKKDALGVVTSTRPFTQDTEERPLPQYAVRTNYFGSKVSDMDNAEDLRGTIVTANTQDQILPGLVDMFLAEVPTLTPEQREQYRKESIFLVVTENGQLIDKEGKTIPGKTTEETNEAYYKRLYDNAIFQVFPAEDLTSNIDGKKQSMFRDNTPEHVRASLKEQYKSWRDTQLANTSLPKGQKFKTSFGNLDFVKYKNQEGKEVVDTATRTPVQQAGLLAKGILNRDSVITVATNNDGISEGRVSFKSPKGRVFLRIPGQGLVKLQNKKFTKEESETIFDAMYHLAKNASENGSLYGGEKEEVNKVILSWLKSVVYWGIAKNSDGTRKPAGYNNIWFEDVPENGNQIKKLFLSGLQKESQKYFDFTPQGLQNSKQDILGLLNQMYANVDAKKINIDAFNAPYDEIVRFDSLGNPEIRTWNNYQTYLLSENIVDSKGNVVGKRNNNEIPLTTQARPLTSAEDTNRKGIYFTLNNTVENNFYIPETPIAKKEEVTFQIETEPVVKQQQPTAPGKYNVDGTKENSIVIGGKTLPNGITTPVYNINFTFDINKISEYLKGLKDFTSLYENGGLTKEFLNILKSNKVVTFFDIEGNTNGISAFVKATNENTAEVISLNKVFEAVAPQVASEIIPVQPAIADEVPITQPETVVLNTPSQVKPDEINIETQELTKKEETTKSEKVFSLDDEELSNDVEYTPARVAQLIDKLDQFTPEQWDKVEEAIAKMLPNIPFYRTKNIIKGTNGRQLWGMLHDAAIYVYEGAEIGTAYHEVFEAVWKMFAGPEEKQSIINEFKTRKGSFIDRESGKTITYKEATPHQIKEQLAEEFRDAVLNDKLGKPSESKSLIGKLFRQLIDFIKSFFTGENAQRNTTELFNKIEDGYYSQFNPYESQLSYANKGIIDIEDAQADTTSEGRSTIIPQQELHDIIQHMTFLTLTKLSLNNESVFNVTKQNKMELYKDLKLGILRLLATEKRAITKLLTEGKTDVEKATRNINNLETLANDIQTDWEKIIEQHEDHLRTYNIEFDENDDAVISDENNNGRDTLAQEAVKIDAFKKSNAVLKMVLGTLPVTQTVDGKLQWEPSSIGGVRLLPANQIHADLTANLHDSITPEDMLLGLKTLAESNPNYEALYRRFTQNSPSVGIDFNTLKEHDWQLISAFWKSIKKQNPDVYTIFIQDNGEIVVSDSTLSNSANKAKRNLVNDIVQNIKGEQSNYFRYVPSTGKYYAKDNIKAVTFNDRDLTTYTNFLSKLGIDFNVRDLEELTSNQLDQFKSAVKYIKQELSKVGDRKIVKDENNKDVEEDGGIKNINTKSLNIDGDLFKLAVIKAVIENTEFQSTYFNINGEKSQAFIGTNIVSSLHNALSKINNIEQLQNEEKYKQYAYLGGFNDAFVQGSQMLKKMFDITGEEATGKRIKGTEDLMKPVIIDGIVDEQTGKKKESSKLTLQQRLIQSINLNLTGIYENLVPGDASLEHAIKMHSEKDPFVKETDLFNKGYLQIFEDYFIAEVELSKQQRNIAEVKSRTNKDLRFFKGILGDSLHNKLINRINSDTNASELYRDNKKEINETIEQYIKEEAEDVENLLRTYDVVKTEDGVIKVDKVNLSKENEILTQSGLSNKLKALSINYMIANIEMHKLIYSDPYQYKDELKRIKNFNSPGEPLVFGSKEINSTLDRLYNKGFKKDDIGWTDMNRDYFRSVTLADTLSTNENIGYDDSYEETDGGGYISLKAKRIFALRSGSWTANNEKQYQFDIAFEKLIKSGASEKEIKEFLKENPGIKDTYTPIKPIVRGNKENGRTYNDVVLHKFALVPLSFRILHELNPNSNAIKLYNKMQKEDVDYAVYASGSKVGTEKVSPLYNKEGEFDETSFQDEKELKGNLKDNDKRAVSNIPFSIVAVQSEVPSKDTPQVTQGSQITKLATMDYLQSGVPIDFKPSLDFNDRFNEWIQLKDKSSYNEGNNIYNEIKHNQELLEARINDAVETLYKKSGIKEIINEDGTKSFEIEDKNKLADLLKSEIAKREVNYNILDSFEGFKKGDVILEATPIYQQVRNILYSIADKTIVRPKISGGMKVQVASTLLEEGARKVKNNIYESDVLSFYQNEDGKRVCEIMLGRWFKSNKSDKELMDYFNNDLEGKKEFAAITGVAFRIPTQKQNSIDVFKIKQFLPKDFGDSVIIPSALVKKAGSDFDIDKLSIYLKNLFTDNKGNVKRIPYLGIGEEAKNKFSELYDKGEFNKYVESIKDSLHLGDAEDRLLESIFPEEYSLQKEDVVNTLYKKSLENEYIQSLENLISHPLNYDNLVKPNDATPLKELSEKIQEEMGNPKVDYGSVNNMLSRRFMTNLRQSFVTGKYAIGIAAVGQTGHAQRQRAVVYIDTDKLEGDTIDKTDKTILGYEKDSNLFATDSNINFQEYNSAIINGKQRPMLSWIKNKAEEYISDINGMFIDGYVDISKGDWIMKLGATPNVASTWLFLIDLGVPIKTIGYFMNQPIIRDYLRTIENKGYSWLYIEDIIEDKLDSYNPSPNFLKQGTTIKQIPSEKELFNTLKYNKVGTKTDMSDLQKAQQQYMLKEFLKYSKMASHMFDVSRASNYDTANINDPSLILKKIIQLEKARRSIISSVDDIIDASFIKILMNRIFNYRDAFATILMSDRGNIRQMLQNVLIPYADMSDRDFVKLSQKAVNDLFDWAVQNNTSVNTKVASILLGTETEKSAAQQIMDYRDSILGNKVKGIQPKTEHPLYNNIILKSIKTIQENGRKGKAVNLELDNRENKIYDQNLTIAGFNELRETLRAEDNLKLYGKLTRLALLQSGLTNSPISFTNLLPYQDFQGMYNDTLSILENLPNLADFNNLNVFERNNWNNSDIVKYKRAKLYFGESTYGKYVYNLDTDTLDKSLKDAVKNGELPKLVGISPMSEAGRSDFIVYNYEDYISPEQRILRNKLGNTEHKHKVLMQKVYTEDSNNKKVPLTQITEKKNKKGETTIYTKYIYKAINAWGDSFRAQEFYDTIRPSVLDNGFDKIPNEVEDDVIVGIYKGDATTVAPTPAESENTIYSKLGNKTKSENVVIKSWGELKDATKPITNEGIVSTRISTTDYNFGNPFSERFGGNLIKVNSIKEAVERYINWILTGKIGEYVFDGIQSEELDNKREWILEQLKSGELKNKPILYYKELGEPSHATALDYLINNYDWSNNNQTVSKKPEGIEQEEWDSLSQEEQEQIKKCE